MNNERMKYIERELFDEKLKKMCYYDRSRILQYALTLVTNKAEIVSVDGEQLTLSGIHNMPISTWCLPLDGLIETAINNEQVYWDVLVKSRVNELRYHEYSDGALGYSSKPTQKEEDEEINNTEDAYIR